MSLPWTSVLLVAGMAMTLIARWHESRPRTFGRAQLFPAPLVMGIGLILTVLAAAHMVTLLTGLPLHGRRGL